MSCRCREMQSFFDHYMLRYLGDSVYSSTRCCALLVLSIVLLCAYVKFPLDIFRLQGKVFIEGRRNAYRVAKG